VEESILNTIFINNLKECGITQDLGKSTKEQLLNIEKYFIECEKEIESAIKKIHDINLTVRGISKAIGIGKSTIYNNPTTLKIYIEKRQEQIQKQDIFSEKRIEKLEEKNKNLNSLLEKMKVNIINHHLLENEVENLKEENAQLENKMGYLIHERTNLVEKINDLEKELHNLREKGGNILKIRKSIT
jgi:chromosome segregation ATPase